MIDRRIPAADIQKGLYDVLKKYQTTPVYDKVPKDSQMPYIVIGEFTGKPNGGKSGDLWDTTTQLHIYSEYDGKSEVNEIADDICTVISNAKIQLPNPTSAVLLQDIDMFEAYESDGFGYHGTVSVLIRVQQKVETVKNQSNLKGEK